jgi:ABC-type multidrug transport system permease subunit
MYHGGIDAIASLISIFPVKLLGVSLFSLVIYFLSNLKREAGAFFTFLLFTYTMVLIMASFFRLIGALNKHEVIATSIGGVFILPLVVYTGCEFCNLKWIKEIADSIQISSLNHPCILGSSGLHTSTHSRMLLKV